MTHWNKICIGYWDKQYVGNWDKECAGNWDKECAGNWDKQCIANWDKQHIGYWDVTPRGPGGQQAQSPCRRHGFLACRNEGSIPMFCNHLVISKLCDLSLSFLSPLIDTQVIQFIRIPFENDSKPKPLFTHPPTHCLQFKRIGL